MLFRELLANQLEEKKTEFVEFCGSQKQSLDVYLTKIARLEETSLEDLKQRFELIEESGAMLSAEFVKYGGIRVPFDEIWTNHEDSRKWAFEILQNRTTFAVDGSQIAPTRDISLNVAAVQVGWFENPHSGSLKHEKNADFFILLPDELDAESGGGTRRAADSGRSKKNKRISYQEKGLARAK